jgi:hypothetical protein
MNNVIYLTVNQQMEALKQDEPFIYDYFIRHGYELVRENNHFYVQGKDFDLSFDLFMAVARKALEE